MKKYTLRCFLQHCKIFFAFLLLILVSSFLSFQMVEFACWLRQCNCLKYLNQESNNPHLSSKGKTQSEIRNCIEEKQQISSNMLSIDLTLKCDLLSGLNSKTENQCLQDEVSSFQLFQENQVDQRFQLNADDYFDQFKTVGFRKVEKYESETPLAFAIVVHNQIGQFEALLGSLFRPQNSYCIYLDKKTTEDFKSKVEKLVTNYKQKFPMSNIFLAEDPQPVFWGDPSILNADLACMKQLLSTSVALKRTNPESRLWKFFLNLAGTVMPQQSVQEMAKILNSFEKENGPPLDSIESSRDKIKFFQKRYKYKFYMPKEELTTEKSSANFEDKKDFFSRYVVTPRTDYEEKSPIPFNLTIYKGYRESIISRETSMFMTTSKVGTELHAWLQDAAMAEEFFFATIARIDQKLFRETGAVVQENTPDFDTQRGLCNRLSLWSFESYKCKGKFKRWICNMGLEDVPFAFMQRQCFFLNKFDLKVDPLPISCLYQHWTRST